MKEAEYRVQLDNLAGYIERLTAEISLKTRLLQRVVDAHVRLPWTLMAEIKTVLDRDSTRQECEHGYIIATQDCPKCVRYLDQSEQDFNKAYEAAGGDYEDT